MLTDRRMDGLKIGRLYCTLLQAGAIKNIINLSSAEFAYNMLSVKGNKCKLKGNNSDLNIFFPYSFRDILNPFMPSGLVHLNSLDSSISNSMVSGYFLLLPCFIEICVFNANSVDPNKTASLHMPFCQKHGVQNFRTFTVTMDP